MSRRPREHLPTRPTWRFAACGIAWPCSAAKLRLLARYRTDRPALLIHLATLQAEAGGQLAELDHATTPADLTERFTAWAHPR
ncbi:flavin reductase [Micromonospora phytophila]|uniref:flavin reductase n=1 Tax=Micromonospora phytophila TaxID=709888 RepID=UPI00202E757B|nr:flavin reductase [Micromonospora phytophila]MCM0677877.1 flavin reductase [Micromonospora phytophila]